MNRLLINELNENLKEVKCKKNFMEVCGTHTMVIGKMGLRNYIKDKINLISGPGCPVCVTDVKYIDYIYSLALNKNISIITYGDMLRVPGSNIDISLINAKAKGADVRVVYSAIDSIKIAKENKNKNFVFLAIGFETTMPSTCILIKEIIENNIKNLKILSLHKKIEPVIKKLIHDDVNIDGFLCPGNVAVILGEDGFKFIEEENQKGVITGFSEDEILIGINELINITNNINNNKGILVNKYKPFVRKEGNTIALEMFNKYFSIEKSLWRGLGIIENSGFGLKDKYKDLEIKNFYDIDETVKLVKNRNIKHICRCGDILKGKITPKDCECFNCICTPAYPLGPCMVSSEGTCGAYYRYERR